MSTVKEILNRKKLPKGYPPSMMDVKTREKHAPDSINYNLKHIKDHGKNACDQLDILKIVNPSLAKAKSKEAIKCVKQLLNDLENWS